MEKTSKSTVSRESDKFMLRFPDGMRDKIAEAARANNRSMNAEIVARLEASFSSRTSPDGVVAMFEAYKAEVDKTAQIQQDRISILGNAITYCYFDLKRSLEMLKEYNRPFENTKQDRSPEFFFIERLYEHIGSLFGPVFKFEDITTSYHSLEDLEKNLTTTEQRNEWLKSAFPIFRENEPWPIRHRYKPGAGLDLEGDDKPTTVDLKKANIDPQDN